MKLSYQTIINLYEVLITLKEVKLLNIKTSLKIIRNIRNLENEVHDFEQAKNSIIHKYGIINEEENTITIPEDKISEAQQELNEIISQTVDVDITLFTVEELDGIGLTIEQVGILYDFIEE